MTQKKKTVRKRRTRRAGTKIAYQNKDISSKIFGEKLKGKSLSVYGIRNACVEDVRPTNLPSIEANELRLDNLFLMEDGAYAILDYESSYSEDNKIKYLGYVVRITKKLYDEFGEIKHIRIIVIYTADVKPGTTDPVLDAGSVKMEIEESFLTAFDSERIKNDLEEKAKNGERFTDEDMMRLVIYPLTYSGKEKQELAVSEAIDIAEKLNDENAMRSILSGIFVFADKVMSEADAQRIIRRIEMTKFDRILQEREDKAVEKAVEVAVDKTRKEEKRGAKREKMENALNFLRIGVSESEIAECMNMSLKEVQALAAKM